MTRRTTLSVLICGAIIVTLAMGVRQSFGLFLRPISLDLGTGREVFGLAIALQNLLWGAAQPFVGAIADRFGAVRVLLVGAALYTLGLVLAAYSTGPTDLYLTLGVLIGLSLSAVTYVTVLGSVARVVSPEKRSLAFGVTTAAGSFGMFAVVPGAQALLANFTWQGSLLLLAIAVSLIAGLAFGLRGSDRLIEKPTGHGQSIAAAVREARGHGGYWLLTTGFFVCGFHVAFIATHLPAYLADAGLPMATAAYALAMIGFFNILGSLSFGALGGRFRKKYVLSLIYLARAVVIALFVWLPLSNASAIAFGAVIGFLWLGTVPLTSGIVGQIFGIRYLSMLYGFVFFGHQVGSFLGAWLGGYFYDLTGSYDIVWFAAIALGVVAALLHWPIADQPMARLKTAPA